MSYTYVPLDSFRLARYARPVPCFVCGEDNPFDADDCHYCHAPLALTYQVAAQRKPPLMLAVLAPRRAGKTAYLGMLTDMLSRSEKDLHFTARGAFSVALQQAAIAHLCRGWYPPATPREPNGWNWVHCEVSRGRRRKAELIIPDISGDVLVDEIEHPRSQPLVHTLLSKSVAAIILLDMQQLLQGDRDPDFFAMKCISYLCEVHGDKKKKPWARHPVAFLLTKSDASEREILDPAVCIERLAPATWQQCRQRLERYAFFACRVAVGTAHQRHGAALKPFPRRVEPRGVVDPFYWLAARLGI